QVFQPARGRKTIESAAGHEPPLSGVIEETKRRRPQPSGALNVGENRSEFCIAEAADEPSPANHIDPAITIFVDGENVMVTQSVLHPIADQSAHGKSQHAAKSG